VTHTTPAVLPSFMPDALPIATLPIYPALGLALHTAGFNWPSDFWTPRGLVRRWLNYCITRNFI